MTTGVELFLKKSFTPFPSNAEAYSCLQVWVLLKAFLTISNFQKFVQNDVGGGIFTALIK